VRLREQFLVLKKSRGFLAFAQLRSLLQSSRYRYQVPTLDQRPEMQNAEPGLRHHDGEKSVPH
jgi:hypothetical protein